MQEACLGSAVCKLRLLKPQGQSCPGCLRGAGRWEGEHPRLWESGVPCPGRRLCRGPRSPGSQTPGCWLRSSRSRRRGRSCEQGGAGWWSRGCTWQLEADVSSCWWAGAARAPERGWAAAEITESQNHRIVGVGRDLCGSSSPTLLPKQGHLQQAAQDLVQARCRAVPRHTEGLSPRCFPQPSVLPRPSPCSRPQGAGAAEERGLSPSLRAAGAGKAAVPRQLPVPVAGTAPGQRRLGEQPQAEAPRPPHLPGGADPARDADQGHEHGDAQGPADSLAGEGLGGCRGFPGASLGPRTPALLLCPGRAASDVSQPLRASVSPVKCGGLCAIAFAMNWVLRTPWDELGEKGREQEACWFMCLASESRAVLPQAPWSWALPSVPGRGGVPTPHLPLSSPSDSRPRGWG